MDTPTPTAKKESARTRRVGPAPTEPRPEEVFDPHSAARPAAAAVLLLGPLLAGVGVLGWVRLVAGVPFPVDPQPDWPGMSLNLLLVLLFVVPHSILARGVGRRWLNQPLGPAGERPLYVLIAGASLCLLSFGWTTSGPTLWDHEGILGIVCRAVQVLGGILIVWSAWVTGAAHLLGLPHLRALESGRQPPSAELVALPPYRWSRHPMNLGFLMVLAGMPEATLDRALLLVCFAVWILLAAPWEERDSHVRFGEAFDEYLERTPRWIPRFPPAGDG